MTIFKNCVNQKVVYKTLFPLFIMIISPNSAILLSYIIVHYQGNIGKTFENKTVFKTLCSAWSSVDWY